MGREKKKNGIKHQKGIWKIQFFIVYGLRLRFGCCFLLTYSCSIDWSHFISFHIAYKHYSSIALVWFHTFLLSLVLFKSMRYVTMVAHWNKCASSPHSFFFISRLCSITKQINNNISNARKKTPAVWCCRWCVCQSHFFSWCFQHQHFFCVCAAAGDHRLSPRCILLSIFFSPFPFNKMCVIE